MWALIAIIVLYAMSLGIYLVKDGEPKEENYSFIAKLISTAIEIWLLYEAGLFDKYI